MKPTTLLLAVAGLSISFFAPAQDPSGHINYEVMQRVDLSQTRMVINGQEVRPGGAMPGGGTVPDIPETRSYGQELLFAGNYAREKRDDAAGGGMMMMRRTEGPEGSTETRQGPPRPMSRPFVQQRYLDLTNGKSIEVMTIKKDSVSKTYRTDSPVERPTGWQEVDKTKKLAGYVCHKATCPFKGETLTIWYTTDLPMTYSPIAGLTPAKGVVLQIEGENVSYKATKVDLKPVADSEVTPPANAVVITKEEMDELRKKAMADFRQKMMSAMPDPR